MVARDLKTHQAEQVIDGNFRSLCSLENQLVTAGFSATPHQVKVWAWQESTKKFVLAQDLTPELEKTHKSKLKLVRPLGKNKLVVLDDWPDKGCAATISLWHCNEQGQLVKKHAVDFATIRIWGFAEIQNGQQFLIWDPNKVFILDQELRSAEITGVGLNGLQVLPNGKCFFSAGKSIQMVNLNFGPIESVLPTKLAECEVLSSINASLLRLIAAYVCNYNALPQSVAAPTIPEAAAPSYYSSSSSTLYSEPRHIMSERSERRYNEAMIMMVAALGFSSKSSVYEKSNFYGRRR